MKSALARLGIRGFKPHLRKAPERLAGLRTAEGTGLPANIIEEFRRDMARLALVREQISSIEKTRAERLERAPNTGPHAMVRLLARVIGIGIETADMLVRGDPVAEASRSKSAGALRRAHGIARRERFEKPREGPGQGRQCAGTTWADPVGMALPDVPERQCAGAVVSHADKRGSRAIARGQWQAPLGSSVSPKESHPTTPSQAKAALRVTASISRPLYLRKRT